MKRVLVPFVLGFLALGLALPLPAGAQGPPIKIGMSLGITGYLADIDQAVRDGALLAVEKVNREGGVLGRKLETVFEDMRSEPQQTVTVVNKLIVSEKVSVLINGCSSAGNSAAAPIAARHKVPMVLCSILPPAEQAEGVRWSFSTLAPAAFEVVTRYEYLQKKTRLRNVGVLHDPTPYANVQRNVALAQVKNHGLTVVGVEQYKVDDTDMKAQLTKLGAAGAEAILKFGTGPTTIVVAKNMRELGMTMPLLASTDDLANFKLAAEAFGERFFFVAYLPQVPDVLGPNDPVRKASAPLLEALSVKYPRRDPSGPGRGWDAVNFVVAGIKAAGSTDGEKLRTALEGLGDFAGANALYQFTARMHAGVQVNPLKLVQIVAGQVRLVHDPAAK